MQMYAEKHLSHLWPLRSLLTLKSINNRMYHILEQNCIWQENVDFVQNLERAAVSVWQRRKMNNKYVERNREG